MTVEEVDAQIAQWRRYVERHRALETADVDELETHLRDQIDALERAGLSPDEGFLVAVQRLGRVDELSREFAREHSVRMWKQLVVGEPGRRPRNGLVLALALAVVAAILVKLPALAGGDPLTTLRFAGPLVLAPLAAYFLVRRRSRGATIAVVAGIFAVVTAALAAYPFVMGGQTIVLAAIHAVVALWFATGIAYADGAWRSDRARMDVIRFTGEWVVYYALIALGGGVLTGLTLAVFGAIGLNVNAFVAEWMLPCGAAGAVVVAAWLVEAKQSVVENMAPVLTRVFTPLFTLLLLTLVVAAAVQRDLVAADRNLLILFDIVLLVVLGLLLYALSSREPTSRATWFDRLQLLMLGSAVVVDVLVMIAVLARIGAYGLTANKVAALGLNVILLANLVYAGILQWRFVRGRVPLGRLERWQTGYLPVFFAWSVAVVVVLPPVFAFG
ncbi:permease prefix domain 1-containing protein [Microbacterium sp. X-17]|uniref:permease prefix domain 1-containing protein n=1 Tax=Microbacterium sp. X-17 TaxID=3144404 RepID=UPI0031F54791